MESYDVLVIGGGGAGISAALSASRWGAKVLLVEKSAQTGGDCTWTGCVPSKALIKCARVAADVRNASAFGVVSPAPVSVDFKAVRAHWQRSQENIYNHDDSPEVLASKGVEVRVSTEAVFVSPNVVELRSSTKTGRTSNGGNESTGEGASTAPSAGTTTVAVRANKVILCVGAHPVLPFDSIHGLDSVGCVTSDTLWKSLGSWSELPRGLVVLGGGPIGCEIAQAFARLGTRVTLVGSVLPREDKQARELVAAALARDGVTVLPGRCKSIQVDDAAPVAAASSSATSGSGETSGKGKRNSGSVASGGGGGSSSSSSSGGGGGGGGRAVQLVVSLPASHDKGARAREDKTFGSVAGDVVLCALGRSSSPSLAALALDKAGVATTAASSFSSRGGGEGKLVVDKYLRCANARGGASSHVFACGDCVGGPQFTHLAGYQGSIAAWNATMPGLAWLTAPEDESVPRCTFTKPEVASVGFTSAEEAVAAGHPGAQATTVPLSTFDRAVCEGTPEGFVRLVHQGVSGQLLGCAAAGAEAGELVAELALARKNRLSVRDVATTMHPYPTMAFGLQVAAANQLYSGLRQQVRQSCFLSCFRWCCCGPALHGD